MATEQGLWTLLKHHYEFFYWKCIKKNTETDEKGKQSHLVWVKRIEELDQLGRHVTWHILQFPICLLTQYKPYWSQAQRGKYLRTPEKRSFHWIPFSPLNPAFHLSITCYNTRTHFYLIRTMKSSHMQAHSNAWRGTYLGWLQRGTNMMSVLGISEITFTARASKIENL